jgi:hypothetical protein
VWAKLAAPVLANARLGDLHAPLRLVLERGPLAERIVRSLGEAPTRAALGSVYGRLCDCVEAGRPFEA